MTPVLYSFRRCPYAIRARMALAYAGVTVELREVVLKNKPAGMLALSPKGTVPVLQLPTGQVLDESLEIMRWALAQHDPAQWQCDDSAGLIAQNDGEFKYCLDRYKYADRHPEQTEQYWREQAEVFLQNLEQRLESAAGQALFGEEITLIDVAIFPFIRQFSKVDWPWFEYGQYPLLKNWLLRFEAGTLFQSVMKKYPPWQAEQTRLLETWSS